MHGGARTALRRLQRGPRRVAQTLERFFRRWMPDSFAVAIILTLVTFASAVLIARQPPQQTLQSWYGGFWDLLTFTNQIVLTLLLGYALAFTPPVRRLLQAAGGAVRTPLAAYVTGCLVTAAASLVSWGLGLIAGALVARAIAVACHRRGVVIHYPLLVGSAFSGYVVWHQGLSSSIGLVINTPGHFLESRIGLVPVADTLLSSWSVLTVLAVVATLPVAMALLHPRNSADCEPMPRGMLDRDLAADEPPARPLAPTPSERIENSRLLNWFVVLAGGWILGHRFVTGEAGLDLNSLNFAFIVLGLALSRSPYHYGQLILDGGRVAAPFLLQYPFYAGIAGVMAASGLAAMLVDLFVSVAAEGSLPFWGFVSAGILNVFVPSGGGQWAIQGPIMMDAALALGADIPRTAMAVALGDQWTNVIHPLVLIPFVTIAGLHLRQVMGFCVVAFLWTGLVFLGAVVLF